MNALDYLLKANLYGLLFVGCYWLFLRRHTFFSLNRAYLLLSALLSLALPLVHLPTKTMETLPQAVPVGVLTLPTVTVEVSPTPVAPITPTESTVPVPMPVNWEVIGRWVYALIAGFLLVRLAVQVWRLGRLIRQSPRRSVNDYVLVQPSDANTPTFSFFRFLVLNPADTDNGLVLRHELTHIRQGHSADVVGMAILRAIFWAVPMLWLIDRLLRQVHEFLADEQTLQPTHYANFLVEYAFGLQTNTLTNGFFNPSLLKLRIQMLHQRATDRWALSKYALVLPLVFGLLAMTTVREKIQAVVAQATDDTITVSGRVTNAVDGKPLVGASVVIANTGKGTPTDAQGHYTLQNVSRKATLSISFVGFALKVIPVNGRKTIDARLELTPADELPAMGATAAYKAIKPNPAMPIRTPPSSETINGQVYTAVEEPAVFPTGIPGLMQYVAHTLHYPVEAQETGIQGNVFVQFVVLPTGTIGSATVKKGIGGGCNEEALRIVRQMPRWIPGKQNGKPVATQFILPIQFILEKKEYKRTGRYEPIFNPPGTSTGDFPTQVSGLPKASYTRWKRISVPTSAFSPDSTPKLKVRNAIQNRDLTLFPNPIPDSLKHIPESLWVIDNGAFGPLGTEPLYILDGVEIKKGEFGNRNFDPRTDIENITVLKGSSATAYGVKGQYGVILITTKKK